jgi:hypothetical protein
MPAAATTRLAQLLRDEGGLLAGALGDDAAPAPPVLAGGDPDPDLALAVEAIHEGYLLHYDSPRVLRAGLDPDLALLVGDRLYALGLERLAALGDLRAIAILAEVIAAGARAHAAGDPTGAARAWADGTRAVAPG